MFYIITYATHSERYFELLKKSCPDIIVLGYGEKWNGLYNKIISTVNFCKSKQPDDIICFIDGFDSVVLTSKEEILEKYKSFNTPLVFSQDISTSSIIIKYGQDKVFGKCKNARLNSGLYIGTAETIIDFWKDMKKTEASDQAYASRTCNKKIYMKIDVEHKLFYNYSTADTIEVKNNNSIFINNNKYPTSVISAPANNSMNDILTQLNYKNLPVVKYDFKYRISTYAKYYINEFILALIIVGVFIYFKNIPFSIVLSFLLLFSFLEYELYVKHINISNINKILYLIVDFIHLCVPFFVIYLVIQLDCNIQKLLLLNIFYFIVIGLFFYFKRCVLSIISNKLTDTPNCPFYGEIDRLGYMFKLDKPYKKYYGDCKKYNTTKLWMDGNIITVIIVILLNIYCVWKISTGTSCIKSTGFDIFNWGSTRKSFKKKFK
jgi:hypothetical protein